MLLRRYILIFMCLWAVSFQLSAGTTVIDSIISGGIYRKFRLYIPSIYTGSSSVPMVVNLHGLGSNAFQHQYYGNFMGIADTANFLVLHPEGTTANPYWNAGLFQGAPDDVLFISSLIDTVKASYNVDMDRVYCCGLSNGGIMSYYMSCQLSQRIAAIASVAGTMFNNWFTTCKPARAMPVMEIHGTNDNTVPYEGGGLNAAIDTVIRKWVKHNICNANPSVTAIPDTSNSDFSTASRFVYSGGIDGSTVELFKVHNGGHAWPGASVYIDITNKDFDASREIWRFFRQYRMSQFVTKIGLKEHSVPGNHLLSNTVSEVLQLSNVQGQQFTVISIDGRTMMQGKVNEGRIIVSTLAPGIYFLQLKQGEEISVQRFVRVAD